jgi:protein O-GlcNAc transferase
LEKRTRKRNISKLFENIPRTNGGKVKLISFCLWGSNPKYTVGAIKNAELAKEIYPDWKCRFYCSEDVSNMILFNLEVYDNVEIIQVPSQGDWTSMFWRFAPASEEDVEVMISRDTDSRLNLREKAAVDEWLAGDKGFHIMRDHPAHGFPILGGMWGAKKNTIPEMKKLMQQFPQQNTYGTDYQFFASIGDKIRGNVLVHDEFFKKNKNPRSQMLIDYQGVDPVDFPTNRIGTEYVGKPFNSDDTSSIPDDERIFL